MIATDPKPAEREDGSADPNLSRVLATGGVRGAAPDRRQWRDEIVARPRWQPPQSTVYFGCSMNRSTPISGVDEARPRLTE